MPNLSKPEFWSGFSPTEIRPPIGATGLDRAPRNLVEVFNALTLGFPAPNLDTVALLLGGQQAPDLLALREYGGIYADGVLIAFTAQKLPKSETWAFRQSGHILAARLGFSDFRQWTEILGTLRQLSFIEYRQTGDGSVVVTSPDDLPGGVGMFSPKGPGDGQWQMGWNPSGFRLPKKWSHYPGLPHCEDVFELAEGKE